MAQVMELQFKLLGYELTRGQRATIGHRPAEGEGGIL